MNDRGQTDRPDESDRPELTPLERKRQLLEAELERTRRRLAQIRPADYADLRQYQGAQRKQQLYVEQLEARLADLVAADDGVSGGQKS